MNKLFSIFLLLVFFITGCATPIRKSISSIDSSQLAQKGMIVGYMSYYDSKTKSELGGFFGSNFFAYLTKISGDKKVYDVLVSNKDSGYFGWAVEPGTYWIHGCRFKDFNMETALGDMSPNLEVKAGEITYIGHIHYEVGKTHFGKTMKKIFSSGIMENLSTFGDVLVEAEQKSENKSEDMKNYLQTIGLKDRPLNVQIVEGWKYIPA